MVRRRQHKYATGKWKLADNALGAGGSNIHFSSPVTVSTPPDDATSVDGNEQVSNSDEVHRVDDGNALPSSLSASLQQNPPNIEWGLHFGDEGISLGGSSGPWGERKLWIDICAVAQRLRLTPELQSHWNDELNLKEVKPKGPPRLTAFTAEQMLECYNELKRQVEEDDEEDDDNHADDNDDERETGTRKAFIIADHKSRWKGKGKAKVQVRPNKRRKP